MDASDPMGGDVAPVRSYWQTDSIALRLIADVAFAAAVRVRRHG